MEELLLGSYQHEMERDRASRALEAAGRDAARAEASANGAPARKGLRQAFLALFPMGRRLPA